MLVFNFFEFVEIIFEISQEINIARNETAATKFKDYIEKVLVMNIRYKISSIRIG